MKKTILLAILVFVTAENCLSAAAQNEAAEKELADLKKELGKNDAGYGIYNTQFASRYGIQDCPVLSDRELAASLKRCFAIHARLVELAPEDPDIRVAYGATLLYYGRAKEALEQFQAAAARERRDYEWCAAMFWLAEAQYALGGKEAAGATLRTLVGRNANTARRRQPDWTWLARCALRVFEGNEFDGLKLPKDTAMKAFPEPRQSVYRDKFTTLHAVKLALKGVAENDARVRLLKAKLTRLGIVVSDAAAFTISIERDSGAPVEKKEGYALSVADGKARIAARDAQGVLWGVVSLLQVIDPEQRRIRDCEILDWPDTEQRGFLNSFSDDSPEYAAFQKMNSVMLDHCPVDNNHFTPLRTMIAADMARRFDELGLTLFYYCVWFTQCEQLPICEPRTLPFRIEACKRYAKMRAGVYFPFDDVRYPMHPKDKAAYGVAANCDAKHVNDIYLGVLKEYPDFKLIFCPPFYWGPDARASLPEDRENYLASIGRELDPRVDVYWTGAQVKGLDKKPYQVEWVTRLIGRKPSIFQNAIRPHNLLDYMVDPIPWDKIHYDGFCKDIFHFHHNANTHGEIGPISTLADWLWNNRGYDAKRAAKAGVNQVLGPKTYDILVEGLDALAYFDKYRYGELNANILYEDAKDLEAKYLLAKSCWDRAVAYNADVANYSSYGRGVNWAAGIVKGAKNPPDLLAKYKKQIADTTALAIRETGARTGEGDRVYTPMDMQGLRPDDGTFGPAKTARFLKWLRGANTRENALTFEFECDPFPPTGKYMLAVCGIQDELPEDTVLKIVVNGKAVYEGPCSFPRLGGAVGQTGGPDFAVREFAIPYEAMIRHNRVTVSCASPGYNPRGPPYIGVNYVVLRKSR